MVLRIRQSVFPHLLFLDIDFYSKADFISFFQSTMRPSIIVLIASTTLMCSSVGRLGEKDRAAYERVAECISVGTHINLPDEHPPVKTAICNTYKV